MPKRGNNHPNKKHYLPTSGWSKQSLVTDWIREIITMKQWNYRVVKHSLKEKEEYHYAIHEAYYNEQGHVEGVTLHAVSPSGHTLDELQEDCQKYLVALTKPVVDGGELAS